MNTSSKYNLVFNLGKRNFYVFDLVSCLSLFSKKSKSEVKRLIDQGGFHMYVDTELLKENSNIIKEKSK